MVSRVVFLGWVKPRGGLYWEAKERRGDQWEPWGLSQLDSGAGEVSTDAASGEWLRRGADTRNSR